MAHDLSRRDFLSIVGAASAMTINRVPLAQLLQASTLQSSAAKASPVVVRGNARFQILSPSVMRMEYVPAGHFIDALSVAVVNRSWPACPFEVRDHDGWVEIATSKMQVRYKLDSGKFTAENLTVRWKDAEREHVWKPGEADDRNLGGVPEDIAWRTQPGKEPGPLSRNGYFRLDDSGTAIWNTTTQWPEPRPNREDGQDWYFFVYGHDYKGCLRELAQLLGPIPMVPRYVFGTWCGSRAGYSQLEWKQIVSRFREEEIPLDLLVLDSDSTAAVVWSGFDWDPEQFPDPKGFFAWMKQRGVKVTVNEHYDPITRDSDKHFDQIRQAMGLPPDTKEIAHDLANKKYAQLFTEVLQRPGLEAGMAFWWQDGRAPANMPGLNPTLWTRHIEYENLERVTGRRGFVFCRLGESQAGIPVWGGHRYGSFFTGDVLPYWSALELLVPMNVQSGNMLVPYINNLTAGVYGEIVDAELYQRWVQFSAFAPLFWWHGMWGFRLPWEYGQAGIDTVKHSLQLRYQLHPYIYTYSRLAHETGAPLVRGTYLEYPEQERAYEFKQQYLFGRELLVSPITQPGGGQPVHKDIYLPEGEHWFDYFTGRIYEGGQVLPYECPLSRIPLFVKAGSILPMAPEMDSTDQMPADLLILDIYAGKAAKFRLYEDDGTSLEYRKQSFAWTPVTYYTTSTPGEHVIKVEPADGRYVGQPKARRYRLQVHGLIRPACVLINGRPLPEKQMRGDVTAEGWVWHHPNQVTTIDLTTPLGPREAVVVTLENAGNFPDVVAVQAVLTFRERVRRLKLIQKIRWAMLLAGDDTKNQPRIVKVTEGIEQRLNELVENPDGAASHPPDLKGMTAEMLASLLSQPFAPTRVTPELEEASRKTSQKISAATFTPEELHRMTAELLQCRIVASATGTPKVEPPQPGSTVAPGTALPVVHARLSYDETIIGPPTSVEYLLTLPESELPGWAEVSRAVRPDGSAEFGLRAPLPPAAGTYRIKLQATATWGPNQTVVEREVPWVVN